MNYLLKLSGNTKLQRQIDGYQFVLSHSGMGPFNGVINESVKQTDQEFYLCLDLYYMGIWICFFLTSG